MVENQTNAGVIGPIEEKVETMRKIVEPVTDLVEGAKQGRVKPEVLDEAGKALLREIEALGREVANAKTEIASLKVDDINEKQIPRATDELDAVVEHTAEATNKILDACERIESVMSKLSGDDEATLNNAVTEIYEACSFQDITGQRISKVVNALKNIEGRVHIVMDAFGSGNGNAPDVMPEDVTEGRLLANGPQLPGAASSQADIDNLLASFD